MDRSVSAQALSQGHERAVCRDTNQKNRPFPPFTPENWAHFRLPLPRPSPSPVDASSAAAGPPDSGRTSRSRQRHLAGKGRFQTPSFHRRFIGNSHSELREPQGHHAPRFTRSRSACLEGTAVHPQHVKIGKHAVDAEKTAIHAHTAIVCCCDSTSFVSCFTRDRNYSV